MSDPFHRPLCISIEGNIGASKSTFLKWIQEYVKESRGDEVPVRVTYESIEEWTNLDGHDVLQMFYDAPKEMGFAFQVLAMITRLEAADQDRTCACTVPNECLCIRFTERSPFSDLCFAGVNHSSGNMSDVEYAIYRRAMGHFCSKNDNLPDGVVYLRASPETCRERIVSRDRMEEKGGDSIPVEYLRKLHDQHDKEFGTESSRGRLIGRRVVGDTENSHFCPVLVLDVNSNLITDVQARQVRLAEIVEFAESLRSPDAKFANFMATAHG